MPRLTILVAVTRNRAIGYRNGLLYRMPNDLKRFKQLTTGHTIIMGRRTFESFPKGALPNRRNVVLSRTAAADRFPGCDVYTSLEAALASCDADQEVFIIGGADVYRQALPLADKLSVTHLEATPEVADAFFPAWDEAQWTEVFREHHEPDEKHVVPYDFVDYVRVAR